MHNGTPHRPEIAGVWALREFATGSTMPVGSAAYNEGVAALNFNGVIGYCARVHVDQLAPTVGATFGPTNGAQSVRDGAAPNLLTQPAGSTSIAPGGFTQAAINAAPAAGLWLTAGTHTVTSTLAPVNNLIITCAPGAIIDGGSSSSAAILMGSATGVQIRGGVWRNQGNASSPAYASCILPQGANWIVEDCEIGPNYNRGLHFQATGFTARRVYAHDNGFYGISCSTNGGDSRFTGTLVEYCHMKANSKRIHTTVLDAGQKFTNVDQMTCQKNWVELNEGAGLWWDFHHKNITCVDNVVENNWDWGIFYEYSYGNSVIARNYLKDNGEHDPAGDWFDNTQLLISTSDGSLSGASDIIDVHHNSIDGSKNLIGLVSHTYPTRPLTNKVRIHDNDIFMRSANCRVGGQDSNASPNTMWAQDNTWTNNHYHMLNTATSQWIWDSGDGGGAVKTWAQWQAFGFDATGTRDTNMTPAASGLSFDPTFLNEVMTMVNSVPGKKLAVRLIGGRYTPAYVFDTLGARSYPTPADALPPGNGRNPYACGTDKNTPNQPYVDWLTTLAGNVKAWMLAQGAGKCPLLHWTWYANAYSEFYHGPLLQADSTDAQFVNASNALVDAAYALSDSNITCSFGMSGTNVENVQTGVINHMTSLGGDFSPRLYFTANGLDSSGDWGATTEVTQDGNTGMAVSGIYNPPAGKRVSHGEQDINPGNWSNAYRTGQVDQLIMNKADFWEVYTVSGTADGTPGPAFTGSNAALLQAQINRFTAFLGGTTSMKVFILDDELA